MQKMWYEDPYILNTTSKCLPSICMAYRTLFHMLTLFSLSIYLGVRRLYGIFIFSSLRSLYTAFHNNQINLLSYQKWLRVPFSSHTCQHFYSVFCGFLCFSSSFNFLFGELSIDLLSPFWKVRLLTVVHFIEVLVLSVFCILTFYQKKNCQRVFDIILVAFSLYGMLLWLSWVWCKSVVNSPACFLSIGRPACCLLWIFQKISNNSH